MLHAVVAFDCCVRLWKIARPVERPVERPTERQTNIEAARQRDKRIESPQTADIEAGAEGSRLSVLLQPSPTEVPSSPRSQQEITAELKESVLQRKVLETYTKVH